MDGKCSIDLSSDMKVVERWWAVNQNGNKEGIDRLPNTNLQDCLWMTMRKHVIVYSSTL